MAFVDLPMGRKIRTDPRNQTKCDKIPKQLGTVIRYSFFSSFIHPCRNFVPSTVAPHVTHFISWIFFTEWWTKKCCTHPQRVFTYHFNHSKGWFLKKWILHDFGGSKWCTNLEMVHQFLEHSSTNSLPWLGKVVFATRLCNSPADFSSNFWVTDHVQKNSPAGFAPQF